MSLPATTRRAVLALGSNLGDRLELLQSAVDSLADTPGVQPVAVSPVYETSPLGGPPQGDFLNAVVIVDTVLDAATLLQRGHAIEDAHGRVRRERWGPRRLDVDLVVLAGEQRDDEVTLPHPRAHQRAFVLAPWHDVDPDAVLPGRGPIAALLTGLDTSGVRRRDDLRLRFP